VLIACGGTGGHLFPGIAVAEELKARGHRPILLISEKKVDAEASAKYGDLEFARIAAIAKPPTLSLKMLPFMLRLWKTIGSCKKLLQEKEIDVVLGMGGFTSFPPAFAAKKLGKPCYVHDSNAVPGKSNLLTGKYCTAVLLGLEAAVPYFKGRKTIVTGTPVRQEMRALIGRDEARAKLGVPEGKKMIFVFGGSQGAQKVNTFTAEAAKADDSLYWYHVAGSADLQRVEGLAKGQGNHEVLGFCADMGTAYAASDLVVCRSGASSMTELSFLGLPSILVPYPFSADDHQVKNAEVFDSAGAGVMIKEADLEGGAYLKAVQEIVHDQSKLLGMKEAARALSVDDAAAKICEVVFFL